MTRIDVLHSPASSSLPLGVVVWRSVAVLFAGLMCAMVLTGAGQQPVNPWLAASAVPIALVFLYLVLLPGVTFFPEHRREFLHEIPPPGIFALPRIWPRYRVAQAGVLGVGIPIALTYLSTTVLDPLLRVDGHRKLPTGGHLWRILWPWFLPAYGQIVPHLL
ncbi:hypothetical protein [Rhodococcus sp. WY5]|uniref:hypothetical protein n=1 Tax=Rhodococcus sp. WY5 TaxID=2708349 RepID=UPI001BDE0DFC|nr:hypothetical protein [Rhodococcus sp. WY5]